MFRVRILNNSYTVDSDDLYGPCKEGIILITGYTVPIEIVTTKQPNGQSNMKVRRPGKEGSFEFFSDTEQDLRNAHLLALRVADSQTSSHIIVLKLVSAISIKYERLGIADCPHDMFAEGTLELVKLF